MNTFCCHCGSNRKNQSFSRSQCRNNHLHNSLSLTHRGLNQAHRNDSKQIWKLFYSFQQETQAQTDNNLSFTHENQNEILEKQFVRSPKGQFVSYDVVKEKSKNHDIQQKSGQKEKNTSNQKEQKQKPKQEQKLRKRNKKISKQETNHQKEQQLRIEYQGHLKKMNDEIAKHLQKQRYCTRELPNSAFAKFYNRPCVQTYGYGNTSKQSFITRNLLKTHNIIPHTSQNKPQTYQTYHNAILYSKRTKLSENNRQQRIRRQFLKWFDDSIVQDAQLELNRINKQKKSKSLDNIKIVKGGVDMEFLNMVGKQQQESKINDVNNRKSLKQILNSNQPIFVYKYKQKDGTIRLAKDRHGITCYVDSSFNENEYTLLNFMKKENEIYPEKVKIQDMNLDDIRRQNYQKSIEQDLPRHYMMPCVVTPYDKSKYQFKRKEPNVTTI